MSPLRSRFKKETDKLVKDYTVSVTFDARLYRHDIQGSVAHAKMLAKQGIIVQEDADLIISGLNTIREEIEQGNFELRPELEDIHMHIESRLFEIIGDIAGKLHTGRSRNDQVALDLRLYARETIHLTIWKLQTLQKAILEQAEQNKSVIMPAYTHLQRAQPVLLAHHLLAYFEMFQRDIERFIDCLNRVNVLPLGAGSATGSPYPLDREFVACELGFERISQNSLDAVSDRDFVIEFQSAASIAMMHISRLSEEMVLWSSTEFGYLALDDAFTTGSSLMPQKKNPDVAELARGKSGRVYGNLMGILTVMKGLSLAYNRDMQEDKESFFDTSDTLLNTLNVFTEMIRTMQFNSQRMHECVEKGHILATDLADYLVRKGLPFRRAYDITGSLVCYAIEQGKSLHQLTILEYQSHSDLFQEDVYSITPNSAVAARDILGGTAPSQVEVQIVRARNIIECQG